MGGIRHRKRPLKIREGYDSITIRSMPFINSLLDNNWLQLKIQYQMFLCCNPTTLALCYSISDLILLQFVEVQRRAMLGISSSSLPEETSEDKSIPEETSKGEIDEPCLRKRRFSHIITLS
jgi:hypothetical protein